MNRLLTYTNNQEFTCNTFFLVDDSNNAFLVDPGDRSDKFFDFIDKNGLNVIAVLLTHTHYDHIAGLPKIIEKIIVLFPNIDVSVTSHAIAVPISFALVTFLQADGKALSR